jgi:anaerobic selenocysteine-containing dehydrogenase
VYVENGKIVKVQGMTEHPVNRGKLCPKGGVVTDLVYAPDRIRYPMKRENGDWRQISWDEALNIIAARLKQVKERYGARAFSFLFGASFGEGGAEGSEIARRFCDVYGTPNVFSVDSMCIRIRGTTHRLTFGRGRFYDPQNARCILVWGNNPDNSALPQALRIWDSIEKGAKLIVIDPRTTSIAKKADLHIRPRPGTDCALALGLLNVIISEKLYDSEFVDKWTFGFDQLTEHTKHYTPQEVEQITWVPADAIREVARIFARTKPATIVQGANSLDQCSSGTQTNRAICILEAITGNLDVPGGFVRAGTVPLIPLRMPERRKELPLGADKYPFSYQVGDLIYGEGQGMVVPDVILTEEPYAIKAMIISGCNAAVTWPNSTKMVQALRKLDFLVVMDLFMSETARLAHLVLPAATYLEKDSIPIFPSIDHCRRYIMLGKKVIEVEECWPDFNFWLELARRMGYHEDFPWKNVEEVMDYMLKPIGLTVKQLKEEKPEGLPFGVERFKEYEKKGFPTPSGKVEIYSQTMEKFGYDPLPTYMESPEGPVSSPELATEYPLVLTTGARHREYHHSQFRNLSRLRRIRPEPLAEIHPQTAEQYGISDGEMIIVQTKRGNIEIKANVTEDIMPGVIQIPHGWAQANVNLLTDEKPADPVSGFPSLDQLLCKISRKA